MNRLQQGKSPRFGRDARLLTAAMTALVAMVLPEMTGVAKADPPVAMAPPVEDSAMPATETNDIFQWTEIPENQEVQLSRAVFDKSGYQLYDLAGETIVVPFTEQNLYVMKFAVSPDDTLYFVNENNTPVLYVPRKGYLENASVPGAKWYPFSEQFAPAKPVYLGVAPSYTEFVDVGWYPNTVVYGGYYCSTSYIAGGFFEPTFGLTFFIGGRPYYGWHAYHDYVIVHNAPYHIRYVNRPAYYAIRQHPYFNHAHEFHGYVGYHGNAYASSHEFRGDTGHESHNETGHVFHGTEGHEFHGTTGTGYQGHRNDGVRVNHSDNDHVFHGTTVHHSDGNNYLGGGYSNPGHVYTNPNNGTPPREFHGTAPQGSSGRPSGGYSGEHVFHGTGSGSTVTQPSYSPGVRNSGGGDRAFHGAGGQPSGGDRGSRPSGGSPAGGDRGNRDGGNDHNRRGGR